MWLFLNNAFLSVVDKSKVRGCLCVRARVKGDIEQIFPNAKVEMTPSNDYLFRADIPREQVASAIAEQITNIGYNNFKGSTKNRARHDAYTDVWHAMFRYQQREDRGRESQGKRQMFLFQNKARSA